MCIKRMIYDGYRGGKDVDEPKGFDEVGSPTQYKNYEANRWAKDYGFSEPPQPDEHLSDGEQCQVRELGAGKCSEDSGCNPDAARVVGFLNVTFSGTPRNAPWSPNPPRHLATGV